MGNLNLKFSNSNEYLIVSGSNISLLNGIYVKSGTVSGKPKYVKTPAVNYLNNGNFEIIIQGEFPIVWGITTVSYNGYFYYGNSSYASPDLVPAWSIGQNGSGNISIKITAIGKTSIKKQNLGGGKINLRPRVYAFVATGTGLSPNINNLRFYNTGLTQNGQPIYYDETKVYWLTYISSAWIIALIGTVGASGLFVKFSSINPVGSYTGSTGYSGTVTIAAI